MGGRAVAYARRQTVDTVALTIPKKKKTQNKSQHLNLIKCLLAGEGSLVIGNRISNMDTIKDIA